MIIVKAILENGLYRPVKNPLSIKGVTSTVFNGAEYICYQGDEPPVIIGPESDEPQPE